MKTLFIVLVLMSISSFGQTEFKVDSTTVSVLASLNKDTLFVKPVMFDLYVQAWQMEKDSTIKKPVIVSTPYVYQRASRSKR